MDESAKYTTLRQTVHNSFSVDVENWSSAMRSSSRRVSRAGGGVLKTLCFKIGYSEPS